MKRRLNPIGEEDRNQFVEENFVKCECGYNNKKEFVRIYGTCLLCNKIIDPRAYFKRQVFIKMHKKILDN